MQAKKHFTAEELSMRRAEMARRRRNLSEKRNEEVKASHEYFSEISAGLERTQKLTDSTVDGNNQQASQEASTQD